MRSRICQQPHHHEQRQLRRAVLSIVIGLESQTHFGANLDAAKRILRFAAMQSWGWRASELEYAFTQILFLSPMPESDSLTTSQAAALLGVAPHTVQKWVDAGVLRAWKTVGGHRRVAANSVEAMLRDRDVMQQATAAKKMSVMLVEDDADTAELLEALIGRLWPQAHVRLARDGFSALLDAGKQPPDVLITDINLPGLDGVEMLRSLLLHPDTRQMRVVFVTHYAPAELQRFGPLPPGVPVLRKPIQVEDLRRALGADNGIAAA